MCASNTPSTTSTTLRTVPLLAGFPESQLKALAAAAHWRQYAAGEVIARQNETSRTVYFIITGFVKILRGDTLSADTPLQINSEKRSRSRHQVMVALRGCGDILGEVGALLDCGCSATIKALTPCEIISISGEDFLACMRVHPPFATAVTRKMAQRLVEANQQLELMRGSLEGRIHAVIRNCQLMGLDTERWLSNAEIARMVGATRVAVSQIVVNLSKNNDTP